MTRINISLWILSMVILSGCGSSVRIYSDIDDAGRFDQYSSYDFMEFTEGNQRTISGMELERIRVAFAREIENRGLKFSEKDGDVSVQITVYHREAKEGYYGYPGMYNYMERAIAVDLYDNQTRKHVWHCAAVGELEYDPQKRATGLPEVVERIFEQYPIQVAL
ncbi:MAG: DUF4136 domain-containing protein [Bacteroidales bacterium]|nr:DUF4136 domain-containing protein [Bacteroidales bacterium]